MVCRAKTISGRMEKHSVPIIRITAIGVRAFFRLTSETWPDFPVTVVKDFRFPVYFWLMVRIRIPKMIITEAMI